MQTLNATQSIGNNLMLVAKDAVRVGDRVRLISGALQGIEGSVLRCDRNCTYTIGVPDAHSAILVRVHRQRFQRIRS